MGCRVRGQGLAIRDLGCFGGWSWAVFRGASFGVQGLEIWGTGIGGAEFWGAGREGLGV